MSNEQPQILEIKNLSKSYGNLSVLKNLNLSINRGEFIGIVGPNGIGKTTLVGCICGIVKYHSGTIAFHNHQANLTKRHFDHRIGICFQDSTFDRFFPINDSIRFNAMYNGLSRYYSKLRTDYVLNLLRLNEQKNQYGNELSGGMKKRLQLAHALVHEPDILILDEPSAGVDLELKEEIYYILADLHKKGVTIILTSHYIEELGRLCNRVVFIKNGQIQNSYINNTNGEKEIERIYRKLYIKNGA